MATKDSRSAHNISNAFWPDQMISLMGHYISNESSFEPSLRSNWQRGGIQTYVRVFTGLLLTGVTAICQSLPTREDLEQASAAFSADATKLPALTEAVFLTSHCDQASFRHLPGPIALVLRNRFVAAEQAYRSGQRLGISEENIADILNSFASALSLPEFAKTTQGQVRKFRMHLLVSNPQFMRGGIVPRNPTGGAAAIFDVMSPLQALHLTRSMIDQKLVNPAYQVTPEEWAVQQSTGAQTPNGIYHRGNTPRMGEIEDGIQAGLASLDETEGLALLEHALSKMGVF